MCLENDLPYSCSSCSSSLEQSLSGIDPPPLPSKIKIQDTFQTKKKGWISETMLQFCAHVGCTSGAVFRRRAHNMEDD